MRILELAKVPKYEYIFSIGDGYTSNCFVITDKNELEKLLFYFKQFLANQYVSTVLFDGNYSIILETKYKFLIITIAYRISTGKSFTLEFRLSKTECKKLIKVIEKELKQKTEIIYHKELKLKKLKN
jgi:hypothetical protein